MSATASQVTSLMVVYSTVYSDTNERQHQSSASLVFARGIHRWPVNSSNKGPVTRKEFPFDDVIMSNFFFDNQSQWIDAIRGATDRAMSDNGVTMEWINHITPLRKDNLHEIKQISPKVAAYLLEYTYYLDMGFIQTCVFCKDCRRGVV